MRRGVKSYELGIESNNWSVGLKADEYYLWLIEGSDRPLPNIRIFLSRLLQLFVGWVKGARLFLVDEGFPKRRNPTLELFL